MRVTVLFSVVAVTFVVGAAASNGIQPLPFNAEKASTLKAGVTYQANRSFPTVPLRFTTPDGSWSGSQWKTTSWKKKPPFFGWVGIGQGPNSAPLGEISIVTSQQRTRSASSIVNWLRTRGSGAEYGPVSPVKLAGYAGREFDATIVGKEHVFLAFSHPTGSSQPYGDSFFLDKGSLVRIIVLNIRGHAVVIYIEKAALTADQFPAFLTRADAILKTLKFPR